MEEDVRSGAGGGFEYKDKIDCFKSGRERPVELTVLGVVLAGRFGAPS